MKGICFLILVLLVVSATSRRTGSSYRRGSFSRDFERDFLNGLFNDEGMREQVEDESWSDLVMDPACEMECMNFCTSTLNCRERCC
ncbi:hypothetical protein ACROYT_G027958 [Oculina patagonica]